MRSNQGSSLRHLFFLGFFLSPMLWLTGCGNGDDGSDFSDALSTSPGEIEFLEDFFNGKSEENANRAADLAASNMQTNLLIGILVVAVIILITLFIKKKK